MTGRGSTVDFGNAADDVERHVSDDAEVNKKGDFCPGVVRTKIAIRSFAIMWLCN